MLSFKKKTKLHFAILTMGAGVILGLLLFWNRTLLHPAKQLEVKRDEIPTPASKAVLKQEDNTVSNLYSGKTYNEQLSSPLFAEPVKKGEFYTENNIPLDYPPECQRSLSTPPTATLGEFLKNNLYISGAEQFPAHQRVAQLSQYWTKAGKYFQLNAEWTLGYPPSYTLRLLESSDPAGRFNDSTEIKIDKGNTTGTKYSPQDTMKKMANILAAEKKLGAKEGSRQMLIMARSAGLKETGTEHHEAVFHNGNLQSYHASNMHCTLSENNQKHICLCADSKQEE